MTALSLTAERIMHASALRHPAEVRDVPGEPGVYGWWIRRGALERPDMAYRDVDGCELLYVGISPRRPSAAGRASAGNLRKRLLQHVNGNASQSTLRRTLGVLLADQLGLRLAVYGGREHYGPGELQVSRWLHEHARFAYAVDPEPWVAEEELLAHAPLALNLRGRRDAFAEVISARRKLALAAARTAAMEAPPPSG